MNNFLNNPNAVQKALLAGLLGQLVTGFQGGSFASQAGNGAYLSPYQGLNGAQNQAFLGMQAGGNGASEALSKAPEALAALLGPKNGAYLGALFQNVTENGASEALPALKNGAYNAYFEAERGGNSGQNARHRCNLNLEEHQKYADALVSAGIIDKPTGESIKQKMAAVFKAESGSSAVGGPYMPQGEADLADFSKSEFLKARECLLQYLENLDVEFTSGDLAKIEEVVLELEKAAIARNSGGSGSLGNLGGAENPVISAQMANEAAKERLMSSSLGSRGAKGLPQKLFTRDEISKMSTAEFIKNEPQINYQLQNGLL